MDDKQFNEDIQKLKSVNDKTQEVRFKVSEEWSAEELAAAFGKLASYYKEYKKSVKEKANEEDQYCC